VGGSFTRISGHLGRAVEDIGLADALSQLVPVCSGLPNAGSLAALVAPLTRAVHNCLGSCPVSFKNNAGRACHGLVDHLALEGHGARPFSLCRLDRRDQLRAAGEFG
jgi:hypothetical protein